MRREAKALPGLKRHSLVLFLTRSNSLATWQEAGMLERETALYRALVPHLAGVRLVSYGGPEDRGLSPPGLQLDLNRWGVPQALYTWYLRRLWRAPAGAIVKSNQVQGAEIALAAARRQGLPFIARCGYLPSDFLAREQGPDSQAARRTRELERLVFTGADRVVVTTPEMARSVTQTYRVAPERVRVIPNYVDTELFAPQPGVEPRPGRLLFIGRLAPQKNPRALLQALAGLPVELDLVGRGPLENELRRQAAGLGLKVRFLGNQPHRQLPRLMARAQVFVMPSLYEGHPKALIEAMSAGLAVLAGRSPGISGLVEQGRTGYLCGHSAPEIRRALEELLSEHELRRRLGRAARKEVLARFSLQRVLQQELDLYRELVP